MSSFMTLTIGFLLWTFTAGSARREDLQASPLEVLRTARTTVEAFRARSWRADSRPMPALAPVMMMVLPRRLRSGGRGVTLAWVKIPMLSREGWWLGAANVGEVQDKGADKYKLWSLLKEERVSTPRGRKQYCRIDV